MEDIQSQYNHFIACFNTETALYDIKKCFPESITLSKCEITFLDSSIYKLSLLDLFLTCYIQKLPLNNNNFEIMCNIINLQRPDKDWINNSITYKTDNNVYSLHQYKDDAFKQVNKMLVESTNGIWTGGSFYQYSKDDGYSKDSVLQIIKDLDKLISEAPKTNKPMIVYRCRGRDMNHVIGESIISAGITSTSIDAEVAKRFGNVWYIIYIPEESSNVFSLGEGINGEGEILLNYGAVITVNDKYILGDKNKQTIYRCTYLNKLDRTGHNL